MFKIKPEEEENLRILECSKLQKKFKNCKKLLKITKN